MVTPLGFEPATSGSYHTPSPSESQSRLRDDGHGEAAGEAAKGRRSLSLQRGTIRAGSAGDGDASRPPSRRETIGSSTEMKRRRDETKAYPPPRRRGGFSPRWRVTCGKSRAWLRLADLSRTERAFFFGVPIVAPKLIEWRDNHTPRRGLVSFERGNLCSRNFNSAQWWI